MSEATSRQSAAVRGGRKRFEHDETSVKVTTDGYMSVKDAQEVLFDAFEEWGISATSDADVGPYVGAIAQVCRQGTSAERDWSKVSFEIRGRTFGMEVFSLAASKKDRTENPVRVWARSYNDGEIAVRIHDMLKDPGNTQLREEACLDYDCTMDVVHVSFDFAEALVKFEDFKLSQVERFVIKKNTANKVRSSRSTHIGGTEGGTMQDGAAHSASTDIAASAPQQTSTAAINPGGSKGRANFVAMR